MRKTLLLSLSRIRNTIPLSLSGIKDIIPHCGIHSHRIEQEKLCAVISINTFNFSVFITMSARPPTIRGKEFYFNCEGMSSVIDLCSILRPTGNEISANIISHTFPCLTILNTLALKADDCLSDKIVFPFLVKIFVHLIKIYFFCQADF